MGSESGCLGSLGDAPSRGCSAPPLPLKMNKWAENCCRHPLLESTALASLRRGRTPARSLTSLSPITHPQNGKALMLMVTRARRPQGPLTGMHLRFGGKTGWQAEGCATLAERPPFLCRKGYEELWPSWEEQGKGPSPRSPVPAGAFCSALLTGSGHLGRRVEWGQGPLPACPDLILDLPGQTWGWNGPALPKA